MRSCTSITFLGSKVGIYIDLYAITNNYCVVSARNDFHSPATLSWTIKLHVQVNDLPNTHEIKLIRDVLHSTLSIHMRNYPFLLHCMVLQSCYEIHKYTCSLLSSTYMYMHTLYYYTHTHVVTLVYA